MSNDSKVMIDFISGKENLRHSHSKQTVFFYKNTRQTDPNRGPLVEEKPIVHFNASKVMGDQVSIVNQTRYNVSPTGDHDCGFLSHVNCAVEDGTIVYVFSEKKESFMGELKKAGLLLKANRYGPIVRISFRSVNDTSGLINQDAYISEYFIEGRFNMYTSATDFYTSNGLHIPNKAMLQYLSKTKVKQLFNIQILGDPIKQPSVMETVILKSEDKDEKDIVIPKTKSTRSIKLKL